MVEVLRVNKSMKFLKTVLRYAWVALLMLERKFYQFPAGSILFLVAGQAAGTLENVKIRLTEMACLNWAWGLKKWNLVCIFIQITVCKESYVNSKGFSHQLVQHAVHILLSNRRKSYFFIEIYCGDFVWYWKISYSVDIMKVCVIIPRRREHREHAESVRV